MAVSCTALHAVKNIKREDKKPLLIVHVNFLINNGRR